MNQSIWFSRFKAMNLTYELRRNNPKSFFVAELQNYDCSSFSFRSLAVLTKRMVNILFHPDFIYKKTKLYQMERKFVEASELLPRKVYIFYFLKRKH